MSLNSGTVTNQRFALRRRRTTTLSTNSASRTLKTSNSSVLGFDLLAIRRNRSAVGWGRRTNIRADWAADTN